MPYTVKFSRRFCDKLGDDVVNELVDWLNTVDLTYKSELKEHNEINLRRVEAMIRSEVAGLESKISQLESKTDGNFAASRAEFDSKIETGFANIRADMAALRADMIKWMFVFWATTALIVIGLR